MQTNIDSVKKEHESYLEQNTSYFENIVNILVNSDSVIPQDKQNGSEEYFQEDCKIYYDKNESNGSVNASKKIAKSKKIEQNMSKKLNKMKQLEKREQNN